MSAMSTVKAHRITGEQPSHHGGYRRSAGSKQKMKVIGNKRPSIVRRRRIDVSDKMALSRLIKLSLSALSLNIRLLSIPRHIMWCNAPDASIRAFLGINNHIAYFIKT